MSTKKIAYVMSRFPHLPETFILREMNEMERQGWDIELFPLIIQKQPVIHSEASRWLERANRLPFISFDILWENLKKIFAKPAVYFSLLKKIIAENFQTPGFLVRSLALFPKIIFMALQMEEKEIRHVHAHYATFPALAAWIIHQLTGISFSVTVHAHDIFESKPMLGTKLKDASFIIPISKFNRDYLIEYLGAWVEDKIRIVHCGIQPEKYQQISASNHPNEKFEMIHIGSLEPYKGQKYLIEAGRILKERNVPFHLIIIGMGYEKRRLEELIELYDLKADVILAGPKTQEEIALMLPAAHCYVQPSIITPGGTMEGIPVALMEAMSCGLPVIATRISGIPELVEDGESGFLIPPGDAEALATAMERIKNNFSAALLMGLRGREKVIHEFDLAKNVEELGGYVTALINQSVPEVF